MIGQFSCDFGDEARLTCARFTADENHLPFAVIDPRPDLLERGQVRRPPDEWSPATYDKFGRKRWRHPLRHVLNVAAPPLLGR